MINSDRQIKQMYHHFSEVAVSYNYIRTTDLEPVLYIRNKLGDRESIRAVDIGCGGGRYSLLLYRYLPGLHLTCNDVNEAMVSETARYLKSHGVENFTTVQADIADLKLPSGSVDCVLTFNAIHHFDPVVFLNKAADVLCKSGYVFIYTRLKDQNARNIWGRFFPDFKNKEDRLYDLTAPGRWESRAHTVTLTSIESFRFRRTATLQQLVQQAECRHYSTFSRYPADEFEHALDQFKKNIKRNFADAGRIEWFDENVMIVFRKD